MPDDDDEVRGESRDEVQDGGRHDVNRDGQTGKTADDIKPEDYKPKYRQ